MKAVALTRYLPINDPESLLDVELPKPEPKGRDLLVRVQAISVNPVDTKVRSPKSAVEPAPKVLGWDASGIVESVGSDVSKFKAGDAVFYAGDITRQGSNAEFQLVDERLVGQKPQSLTFSEAAALPLTTLTAWEGLYERLGIDRNGAHRGQRLLIIGGAGGVGSIAIQLAKLAGLTVIATASRPETRNWALRMGAHHIIDHRKPLEPQLAELRLSDIHFIANFSNTDDYWPAMAGIIRPQGKILAIVENRAPLEMNLLKSKSATFVWEFMFTRSMFKTDDQGQQGIALNKAAELVDAGKLRTTLFESITPINAANVRRAHALLESGKAIGKVALSQWPS